MAEAEETLMRMAMNDAVCSEISTACGETNVFTGFDSMLLFTCRFCGSGVELRRPVQ